MALGAESVTSVLGAIGREPGTGGGTWVTHGITAEQVLPKVALIEDGSAALGAYARDLVTRAADAGLLG